MKFILGLLIGVVIGAALGMRAATQSGSETREGIQGRLRRHLEESETASP